MTGNEVGNYYILEKLGQGGMATVYKAYDVRDGREVAIKLIRADHLESDQADKLLLRFEIEKRIAKLRHPNIVGVVDYGNHQGAPYLVMNLVQGGTLKKHIGRKMPWREAAALLAPIARALHYLHQNDVVHRDVKPSNILLTETGQPLLSDFGIAKLLQTGDTANLTTTGASIGTPDYMAPEEALGKTVGPGADIYALGIVFYELVTGRRPFLADTPMAVLIKHMHDPLPRPREFVPNLPADVERVLFKALAKHPSDRYETAADFAAVLDKIAAGVPLSGADKSRPGARRSPVLMWGSVAALSAAGIVVLIAVTALLVASNFFGRPTGPTPTASVPTGFVYVADVRGGASSQVGNSAQKGVARGALLPSGTGSHVKTTDGQIQLGLPDGAVVYLGPQSDLELTHMADPRSGSTSTLLTLVSGKVLAVVTLAPGNYFAVQAGSGLRAESLGSTLGAQYDPGKQRFDLDCLVGACRLTSASASLDLSGGQHSWLDAFGGPFAADAARPDVWSYAGLNQAAAATPGLAPATTPAPSETAIEAASPSATDTPTATPSETPSMTNTASPQPSATSTRTRAPTATRQFDTPTPPFTDTPALTATPICPTPLFFDPVMNTCRQSSGGGGPTQPPPPPPV